MPERFAIYYAPGADEPLWVKAAEWLGRDPLTGATLHGPLADTARDALFDRSVSARRYGFHATLKAPMTLAEGKSRAELEDALAVFAAECEPVEIGRLKLALIDGFLALIPAAQPIELTDFAGEVVEAFEPFRALPSAAERERRLKGGHLSERQIELMDRFGYPYVFEQFRFHMTLTDRLPETEREAYTRAAAAHFGALAEAETVLDRLVLFHEPEAGAPFMRLADFMLTGEAADERVRAR
jgi:putative phosphonate metabolism protein